MREIIWFGGKTPAAEIQCSMMDGTVGPPAQRCTSRAQWGVVMPELGRSNYSLTAMCNKHMEVWARSQRATAVQ